MPDLNRSNCSLALSVRAPVILGLLVGMAVLALGVPTARADPGTIYVDADAPGPTHDGTSWATAYTTVQDALAAAAYGDEIWVAEGVYTPDEGAGQTDEDRDATFTLRPGVALYGGFDPQSSADQWAERDWTAHVTVLSGDIDGDDVTDADGVVTDPTDIKNNNAYHVVTGGGVTETARLDGFTVTAGNANGGTAVIDPRDMGGGMYNVDSRPTLTNVSFSGSRADLWGGGVYNSHSNPTLANVTFSGNQADYGGGMLNDNSSPTLTYVTFSGNRATSDGGGMYNEFSSPTLTNITFSGNQAEFGGGVANRVSNPTATSVTFSGNRADTGGGVYNSQSSPTLTNVTFSGNGAEDGGAMYNHAYSGPTLTNVTFSGNQADIRGGAMNNYYESNPTLINCILWGNAAPNGPQIRNGNDSTPVISYSDVQGSGGSGPAWDSTLGTDGGHNIDADPRFVDPVAASAAPTTTGDYHLTLRSPTIDAGNNAPVTVATDLDGNPRIADGDRDGDAVVDMGAYELQRRPVGGVTLARASSGSLRLKLGLAALVGLLLAGAGVVRRRRR